MNNFRFGISLVCIYLTLKNTAIKIIIINKFFHKIGRIMNEFVIRLVHEV